MGGKRIKVQVKDLEDTYGQFLFDELRIELSTKLVQDSGALRETIRHEMVEAALFISGVSWSEKYDQEPIVRALDNIFWPAWEQVERQLGA